jgi:sulfoxide reductase heme-binding subunit YedZ
MIIWLKALVWVACLLPLGQLLYNGFTDNLGANPIEAITRFTGAWTLRFLLITLAVSPLRRISGWNNLIKLRRMLGLFTFFYACLHFSTYLVLDHFFDLHAISKDIVKRPYVTAGFTAFVLMTPLVVTSTTAMIRRLGKRWQHLHRLIYLIAIVGVIHFYWLVKADIRRPAMYGGLLFLLLGYRLFTTWWTFPGKRAAPRPATARSQ